ncbi:hypothetical protein B8W68_24020 [Mycobacterium paraintracellulare]|nr:hypothetical protein B8W68_24020 [Mycobacterium paraintracellulare]
MWARTTSSRSIPGGPEGLLDRSSRPHHCPCRTSAAVETAVVELRRSSRRGQDWIGAELAVPARRVSAILRRHQVAYCVIAIR